MTDGKQKQTLLFDNILGEPGGHIGTSPTWYLYPRWLRNWLRSQIAFESIVKEACAGYAEAIEQLPDAARDYLDKAQDGVPRD